MPPLTRFVSEFASEMGLVPILWLFWRGRDLDAAWWWIAGAFAVSWTADTAALWIDPWLIGAVYPVTQSAIIGAVFLSRWDAAKLVVLLVIVGVIDGVWHGSIGPDILLRSVAWLSIVGIIYPLRQLERLRICLLVAFGLGWVCWMGYTIWPGWTSWLIYQGVRLAGILLFCWASLKPGPRLRVVSATPVPHN